MHNSSSAMANLLSAQTSASVRSWRSSGRLRSIGASGSTRSCLFSAMFQSLTQVRIVKRQQRPLFQLTEEVRQPDANQPEHGGEVHPAQAEGAFQKIGRHFPVNVDQPHQQNEQRDIAQQFAIALQ